MFVFVYSLLSKDLYQMFVNCKNNQKQFVLISEWVFLYKS